MTISLSADQKGTEIHLSWSVNSSMYSFIAHFFTEESYELFSFFHDDKYIIASNPNNSILALLKRSGTSLLKVYEYQAKGSIYRVAVSKDNFVLVCYKYTNSIDLLKKDGESLYFVSSITKYPEGVPSFSPACSQIALSYYSIRETSILSYGDSYLNDMGSAFITTDVGREIVWSNDGKYIYTTIGSSVVAFKKEDSGFTEVSRHSYSGTCSKIAISHDDKFIAVGYSNSSVVTLLEHDRGKEALSEVSSSSFISPCTGLSFHPYENYLIFTTSSNLQICLGKIESSVLSRVKSGGYGLQLHKGVFSPSGIFILATNHIKQLVLFKFW